ncbi:transcription antitermination factor NusB [Nocardioides daeguensis]|uniref:Transcription antitermination protein NusB n=1 Tax=Nocardioides daeguensis TaxID=908359 RepID=A0ABP6W1R1_9ACTN|nr:transcription antitermination factor NusB [Nocardioides daeguensis]MBV6726827.1 transcription antitermination factor NusB [Nocardioides daeguensis]MCR1774421.1 transcription antitermination factor NusB [Nocardioides daeguensis]
MGARTKARKRALDVLYAADLRGETGVEALERVTAEGEAPANPYTSVLVRGVTEHRARIDEVLEEFSTDWSLTRMPAVDRNVLRIGVWELLWADDVPDTVAVTEAMSLVRELSTDESPAFVNGVLGAIQRKKSSLV